MINQTYPFELEPLPYDYNVLEPYIDAKTMELHYTKHFQGYVNKLNNILKDYPSLQKYTLRDLYFGRNYIVDEKTNTDINNNAGGVYNHYLYFKELGLNSKLNEGQLLNEINNEFSNFEYFKQLFKENALSVFGSGYVYLVLENSLYLNHTTLKIVSTTNQNIPNLRTYHLLLTLDLWEHAYYLKNYNDRAAYIDNWFNAINWEMVEQNFNNNIKGWK